jgi:hypothetical protein
VLIDCEDGRVVDLLTGRDAAPLADWLAAHPKPQVICRDRASAYAEGARTGAPNAVQVADRFHLWQNLAKAVGRCVARHKNCLQEPVTAPVDDQPTEAGPPEPSGAMAQRRREHHKLVHDLLAQGAGIRQEPDQDDQAADVRPSRFRPAPPSESYSAHDATSVVRQSLGPGPARPDPRTHIVTR